MSYTTEEYLDFMTRYGRSLTDAPEIFPAFNNYYQDITGGGSFLGNLSLINGERMFLPGTEDPVYGDLVFSWFINNVLMTNKPNPKLLDFNPECDGVVRLRLEIYHQPTGVNFAREEWAYLGYNLIEDCPENPDAPSQFNVFVPFYPNVNPYEEYASMKWDLNGDGTVATQDLLQLLAEYEG